MSWARYDDTFPMRREVGELVAGGTTGVAALGLHLLLVTWSIRNRTAGAIPTDAPGVLVSDRHLGLRLSRRLAAVGLLEPMSYGWHLVDFHRYVWQPPRGADIPKDVRSRIYERDGHTCLFCGCTSDLTIDHIFPRQHGGTDDESNLQTLCRPCNSRKGARV